MSKTITVRFSEEEENILNKRIAESGMTKSDFIRSCCFNSKIIILDPDKEIPEKFVELLQNIEYFKQQDMCPKGLKKEVKNLCISLQNLLMAISETSSN